MLKQCLSSFSFFLQLVLELHPQRDVFGEANGFADDRYFELRLMALHDAGITSFCVISVCSQIIIVVFAPNFPDLR